MKLLLLIAISVALVASDKKSFKDAALNVTVSNELGDDTFVMMPEKNNDEKKAFFGISKLEELDADGNVIDAVKHSCDFKKKKDDGSPVTCEVSDTVEGTYKGENDNAEEVDLKYIKVTHTCALSSCNGAAAKLMVHTMLFKSEGYICMEGCELDDNDENIEIDKSPVFNGTVKYTVEINGWEFCVAGTAGCKDKVATKFRITFSAYSSNKKGMKSPKKKARKAFKAGKNCTALRDKIKKQDEDKVKNPQAVIKKKGMPPICKNAINTMKNKSESQDGFALGDENDDKSPLIRMFAAAVVDGVRKDSTSGVDGPKVMNVSRKDKDGKEKSKPYIVIDFAKFTSKLEYDPSVEMSAEGGTTGENAAMGTSSSFFMIVLAFITLFYIN